MFYAKHDPGPCPVDDCPHHTCVGPSPQLATPQLPARDRRRPAGITHPFGDHGGVLTTATYWRARVRTLTRGPR